VKVAAGLVCLLAAMLIYSATRRSPARVVLWVWERPEDLSTVDPATTELAVLVKSIELRQSGILSRPRFQPVKAPPGIGSISVVRIDSDPGFTATPAATGRVVEEIAHALPSGVRSLQVDYDARESERAFYREVLTRVRNDLPGGTHLSITALASWCLDDPWIRDLPIDEAVPMLFRMGGDRRYVVQHLSSGGDFKLSVCRQSLGLSLDEPIDRLPARRRLFFFSPMRWSDRGLSAVADARLRP
jgi:hypothetical protein